ncbi:hypothetical protein KEM52_004549, partial [Ascosphaera acerosa]
MTSHTGPAVLPQTTVLASRQLSQAAAHDFLAAYLDRAATDPALQPDSVLTGHGPVSAHAGSGVNL